MHGFIFIELILIVIGSMAVGVRISTVRFMRKEQRKLDETYNRFVAEGRDMKNLSPKEQRELICPFLHYPTLRARQLEFQP